MMKGIFASRLVFPAVVLAALAFLPAAAEAAKAGGGGLPDRIIRPMRATDPVTLKAEGVNIRLWGIKPAKTEETPLELKALDIMDSLISDQQVNCKIVGGEVPDLFGRCVVQDTRDLALELLAAGVVVVDRQQTHNSVFATGYEKAQEQARLQGRGVWKFVSEAEAEAPPLPKWLRPHMDIVLPLTLMLGPFCGLLIMALVMHLGLKRLGARQQRETAEARRKEEGLAARERQILVSTLEGELLENKNKIEAFLAIYGDMLRDLQNPVETPKYQQAGDIVQKHPAFSKTVFEANVAKLSLLDIQTAGLVSRLYAALPKETEYVNLEPHVPIDTAIQLIEKILSEARMLLPAIEQVIKALQKGA